MKHGNVYYQQRLARFMADIERISQFDPKERYLYPILDTPVFSDLETALMMAELKYEEYQKQVTQSATA